MLEGITVRDAIALQRETLGGDRVLMWQLWSASSTLRDEVQALHPTCKSILPQERHWAPGLLDANCFKR